MNVASFISMIKFINVASFTSMIILINVASFTSINLNNTAPSIGTIAGY